MTPETHKNTCRKLIVLGVLAFLLAVNQTVLYFFANAHLKEILQKGSVKLFGFFPVTERAALANPNLTAAVIGLLLSAACFFAVNRIKKRDTQSKNHSHRQSAPHPENEIQP